MHSRRNACSRVSGLRPHGRCLSCSPLPAADCWALRYDDRPPPQPWKGPQIWLVAVLSLGKV